MPLEAPSWRLTPVPPIHTFSSKCPPAYTHTRIHIRHVSWALKHFQISLISLPIPLTLPKQLEMSWDKSKLTTLCYVLYVFLHIEPVWSNFARNELLAKAKIWKMNICWYNCVGTNVNSGTNDNMRRKRIVRLWIWLMWKWPELISKLKNVGKRPFEKHVNDNPTHNLWIYCDCSAFFILPSSIQPSI